jgi:predicted Zn-dependent protease
MNVCKKVLLFFGFMILVFMTCLAKEPQKTLSPVLQAMESELSRTLATLKDQPTPPYFLSYEITETNSVNASGTFGALTSSLESRRRLLDIDLRVGDYSLDNTHPFRGGVSDFSERYSMIEIPIEDNPDAIRSILWYHTDRRYKRSLERLTQIKTDVRMKVGEEDKSGDFSPESPENYVEDPVKINVNRALWEEKVRKYTAPFAKYGDIYEARASLDGTVETRWYVSSEGSRIQTYQSYCRLSISAFAKAEDGMELPRYESFFSFTPDGLPDDEKVLKAVEKMINDLHALRAAPTVEPYTGPAILSGRASGVFFHEVFGHRIEGHRQKRVEEAQTFKKMLNEKVLPETFSVYFDPNVTRFGNADLSGSYRYDNQGVKARRVPIIEKGVLKGFLMSRTPIEGFPKSNGHGRKQPGFAPVSRQSNLFVEVSQAMSRAELKNRLIEQLKKEGKPFGLYFENIQGGFTMTGRTIPNAFNVLPIMVYRIYVDGREELVRGVDLIGTPLTAFSRIEAADDQIGIFNGICGAESGGVPVSSVSPGILVSQIEVQKKAKSEERPPILPPPFKDNKQ